MLALGGMHRGLPIASAGCDATPAVREAVRALVRLGHRRIVALCPARALVPIASAYVVAFREELAAAGITPGDYNTPHWDETPGGCRAILENLFRLTPPTALFAFSLPVTSAILAFTASRGLRVPHDLSLVSADIDNTWAWSHPGLDIAHFDDGHDRIRRHIAAWVHAIASSSTPPGNFLTDAVLLPGNSLAPAP